MVARGGGRPQRRRQLQPRSRNFLLLSLCSIAEDAVKEAVRLDPAFRFATLGSSAIFRVSRKSCLRGGVKRTWQGERAERWRRFVDARCIDGEG